MGVPEEFRVDGKVVVVVGAGRGIGRGVAEVFAAAGCNGTIVAATPTYVTPTAQRLSQTCDREIVPMVADGTKSDSLDAVAAETLDRFGRIDVWVNAIGDSIEEPMVGLPANTGGDVTSMSDARYRQILDINLTSVHAGCRAIGPHFLSERRGRVINIGSCLASRGGAMQSTYVAAKAGVEGLTKALALEWGPFGVTVNCIAPGSFPDIENSTPDSLALRRGRAKTEVPLRRVGLVEEVGYLALFLASDAAAYITGEVVGVDGGRNL